MIRCDSLRCWDEKNQRAAVLDHHAAVVDGLETLPQIAVGGMRTGHHDIGPFFQLHGVNWAGYLDARAMGFDHISRHHGRHLSGCAQHYVDDELEPGAYGDLFHLRADRVVNLAQNLIDPRAGDEVGPARGHGAGDSRLHHLCATGPAGVHVRNDVAHRDADLTLDILAADVDRDAERRDAKVDEIFRLL